MAAVNMSDIAYKEFQELLKSNDIPNDVIRIYLAGMSCSGPSFNLVVDKQKSNDVVEQIHDIKFLVEKDLINQYGSFTLLSGDENGRGSLSIETEIQFEGGCGGGCSGCGH